MAAVGTYLNFPGTAEEAFAFYRDVFGGEFTGPIVRFSDMPGMPPVADDEADKVMNVGLSIMGGHVLMGTDVLESLGQRLRIGNNTTLNLMLDDRAEADRLHARLSDGGSEGHPMTEMPWGYWGVTLDRFGVRWMFTVAA